MRAFFGDRDTNRHGSTRSNAPRPLQSKEGESEHGTRFDRQDYDDSLMLR